MGKARAAAKIASRTDSPRNCIINADPSRTQCLTNGNLPQAQARPCHGQINKVDCSDQQDQQADQHQPLQHGPGCLGAGAGGIGMNIGQRFAQKS